MGKKHISHAKGRNAEENTGVRTKDRSEVLKGITDLIDADIREDKWKLLSSISWPGLGFTNVKNSLNCIYLQMVLQVTKNRYNTHL